jgi:hypothetical protein
MTNKLEALATTQLVALQVPGLQHSVTVPMPTSRWKPLLLLKINTRQVLYRSRERVSP